MPATSDLLNRPCVSEDMAKLAHHRYVQSDCRAACLDGMRIVLAERDWRPIETAPKDGSRILVAKIVDGRIWWACTAQWRTEKTIPGTPLKIDAAWTDGIDRLAEPTHWLVMPEPPRAEASHAR